MTSKRISFFTGQPQILTLERAQPISHAKSQHTGLLEYRYDVTTPNGLTGYCYLPQTGEEMNRLRIGDGDEIRVLKTGKNGDTIVDVRPVSDAHLPVPVLQPRPQAVLPQPQPAVNSAAASEPMPSFGSVQLAQAFMAAVDVALGAESYAAKKGKTLSFNEEDVRCMAHTLYINGSGGKQ